MRKTGVILCGFPPTPNTKSENQSGKVLEGADSRPLKLILRWRNLEAY